MSVVFTGAVLSPAMLNDQIQHAFASLRRRLERLASIPQSSHERFASDPRNTEATLFLLTCSLDALHAIGCMLSEAADSESEEIKWRTWTFQEEIGHLATDLGDLSEISGTRLFRILPHTKAELAQLLGEASGLRDRLLPPSRG